MRPVRFTEAQIVEILAQTVRQDLTVKEVCKLHGIHEQTYYRWKRTYGDMTVNEVRHLRELENENARLKRLLADRDLEIDAIREVLRGK